MATGQGLCREIKGRAHGDAGGWPHADTSNSSRLRKAGSPERLEDDHLPSREAEGNRCRAHRKWRAENAQPDPDSGIPSFGSNTNQSLRFEVTPR
jgi:hypothetical protein